MESNNSFIIKRQYIFYLGVHISKYFCKFSHIRIIIYILCTDLFKSKAQSWYKLIFPHKPTDHSNGK